MAKASGGLTQWFRENWVDLSRPKKGGGYEPCGRRDASSGKYPKCVPAARAAKMTPEQIRSAVSRKRRAESTTSRRGKKPINVSTIKKSKNVPTNPALYARVKAAAKAKFDVYPSAYANGWLVQEYKRRGGKFKTVSRGKTGGLKKYNPYHDSLGRFASAMASATFTFLRGPKLAAMGALPRNTPRNVPKPITEKKRKYYRGLDAAKRRQYQLRRAKLLRER
jgi:hypothetical protein